MGSSRYTFIGAFLAFTKLPSETKPETNVTKSVTCDNNNCKEYRKSINAKFCSECGQPSKTNTQTTTKDVTKTTSLYDLMNEFGNEDILYECEELLLPNRSLKNSITIDNETESILNCPGKEESIQEFRNTYQSFLNFLDLHPGKPQYEIRFGILNYWN